MWLLQENKAPSFMTIDNIDNIFAEINQYIFSNENTDINHVYIDGTIKWNKAYTRARRRGLKGMNFEIAVISCGFNLHKYYLKQLSRRLAA